MIPAQLCEEVFVASRANRVSLRGIWHMGCAARWAVSVQSKKASWTRCFIPRPSNCCEGRDPFPNFSICSRGQHNKRPAVKQGPDLYLEPKWLRCWHYLRCTLDSKMLVQIPCSWPIIKTTLLLRGSKRLQLAQSAQLPRMDLLDATTMPCVCSVAGHLSDLPRIYILSKCIATKYFEKSEANQNLVHKST